MALKSIKIRKLGIEDLEQVLISRKSVRLPGERSGINSLFGKNSMAYTKYTFFLTCNYNIATL